MIFNNQTQKETLPKGYHHLTYDQRCQIYILKAKGDKSSSIATILKVHHSTISRELKRNKGQRGYYHQQAQEKAFLRCLVPKYNGVYYEHLASKETLWDKYYMGAPKQLRRYVGKYKIVKRA